MMRGTDADNTPQQVGAGGPKVIASGKLGDGTNLRFVLERVSQTAGVLNGVLRILSRDAHGLLGIKDGKYITGAILTSGGEVGRSAVHKLLSVNQGTYSYLSLPEQQKDLVQGLNFSLNDLLSWRTEQPSTAPPSLSQALDQPTTAPRPIPSAVPGQAAQRELSEAEKLKIAQRTSRRQALESADELDEEEDEVVAPVQNVHSISKGVLVGGVVGVCLFLILGQQIIQALDYKSNFEAGSKALQDGKSDAAVVSFSSSVKANPNDSKAYLYRALAETRTGQGNTALTDFDRSLALAPHDLYGYVGRATLYARFKRYDQSIQDCTEALKIDHEFLDAYRVRAASLNQMHRFNEAISDATYFIKQHKAFDRSRADAFANRAYALFKTGSYDQAIADYTDAIICNPDNGPYYASRAVVYKQVHDWKPAIADCDKAIELSPGDTSLFKIRSICYAGQGDAETAADDLNKLVKYNPSVANHRMRGNARLEMHDYEGALADFDYVLGAQPHDDEARAKYQQARLGLNGKSTTSAMDDVVAPTGKHQPIDLKLPEPQLVKRGYDLIRTGEADSAIQYLRAAVLADPSDLLARKYLAYALVEASENNAAIEQFTALTKLSLLSPGDNLMYARALLEAKQAPQAVQIYLLVLSADMKNDQARTGLIKSYLAVGDKDKARRLAEGGLAQSPSMKDVYKELLKQAQEK